MCDFYPKTFLLPAEYKAWKQVILPKTVMWWKTSLPDNCSRNPLKPEWQRIHRCRCDATLRMTNIWIIQTSGCRHRFGVGSITEILNPQSLMQQAYKNTKNVWIWKPSASARGIGIKLVTKLDQARSQNILTKQQTLETRISRDSAPSTDARLLDI